MKVAKFFRIEFWTLKTLREYIKSLQREGNYKSETDVINDAVREYLKSKKFDVAMCMHFKEDSKGQVLCSVGNYWKDAKLCLNCSIPFRRKQEA